MNYEEYMSGEPENNDLPSSFLSEEDLGRETNVMILPNLKIDLDLKIANYVDAISECKTKSEIEELLLILWEEAATFGSVSEKLSKLQDDFENLHFDIEGLAAYGLSIEFDDEDD